jgi:hypothetical protein
LPSGVTLDHPLPADEPGDRLPTRAARRPWKRALFAGAAILLALVPFLILEMLCWAFDWGRPTNFEDPFVGFSAIHPLFVLDENKERYEIPKSRQTHFRPESFAKNKEEKEYRIFVLGGSTVQGRPYAIETSFTTWLELSLNAAEPGRHWEVVNCGGVSYASYRLVPILEEVLGYQPDLILICTGHNEFLEDRTYSSIKHASPVLSWPQQQFARLRTFTLLRAGIQSLSGEEAPRREQITLGPEADARLDWKGGLEQYHRDEDWQRGVIASFRGSLRRMQKLCQQADVPLWFIVPVANLEWPPFKSEHRAGLSAEDKQQFARLHERARALTRTDLLASLDLLDQAAAIDHRYAQLHYERGIAYQVLGQLDAARSTLIRAKEEDICPLRMLEPMKEIMHQVAQETRTPLLDADALFARRSRGGIPGRHWLVDHVHPTIEGHKVLGQRLAEEMVEQGIVQPGPEWTQRRERSWKEHFEGLPPHYFVRGLQRLRAVQRWAQGKATDVRKN